MSSGPAQLAVAQTASTLVTTSAQIQKDFIEEPLARQNSVGNRARGGLKGKYLTRSHAMRESASPPRTPTPRSDQLPPGSTTINLLSDNLSDPSKMHPQSAALKSVSPINMEQPHVIITNQNSQHQQQQQQQQQQLPQTQSHSNVVIHTNNNDSNPTSTATAATNTGVICNDVDFPKLTPPKSSKSSGGSTGSGSGGGGSSTGNRHINNNNRGDLMSDKQQNSTGNDNKISPSSSIISSPSSETNYYIGKKMVDNPKSNGQNSNRIHSPPTNRNQESSASSMTIATSSSLHNNNISNNNGGARTNNNPGNHSYTNHSQASPPFSSVYDKENRCPRNQSQNSNNSGTYSQDDIQNSYADSPTDSTKGDRSGKKHRNGANSKGSKPRLKNMSGSSSSMEGGNCTSGFISRDSSMEQFTDQSGTDLVEFFKETLNKNPKNRSMLVKIEKDLINLTQDRSLHEMRFPAMSSYNRMLIHRVAAFFGMHHNVDTATQQCIYVTKTRNTRIPDVRFKTLFSDFMTDVEPCRKSILKRDVHSFDECRQSYLPCPDRGILERKAKSFEEREEEYEKIRRKIFRNDEEDQQYWHYSNPATDHAARARHNNKLLKVQSLPIDRHGGRPSVSKAHSFGGYGGPPQCGGPPLLRGESVNSSKSAGPRLFKQDSIGSTNQSWRLSPSSSGYKTQTQSLRSDSVTPSPTGYGSDDHTPEPSIVQSPPAVSASCGVVWAVTDMASVPRGSVLINPQTLQPIVNQDGSIYHFDPSNLPPNQAVTPGMYNTSSNPNNTNMNINKNMGGPTPVHRKKIDNRPKNNYNNKNDNIQYSNSSTSTSTDGNGGPLNVQSISTSTSTATESSVETLSESSSAQTVVNVNSSSSNTSSNKHIVEPEEIPAITKEIIIIKRENDDIPPEVSNNQEDNEKATLRIDNSQNVMQPEKPKFINQATSPNIPSPEPEELSPPPSVPVANEIVKPIVKSSASEINNTTTNLSTRSTPITAMDFRKDDSKSGVSSVPMMGYATSYQTIDGTTVFQPAGSAPYSTTTYQQGPDGSVYAVPQQMLYAYPQQMDGEIQGYFVYDQSMGRDSGGLVAGPGQAIYQSAGGGPSVVPLATYPSSGQFGGGPMYQQQVVYSPEHYPNGSGAGAGAQMQQYPVTTYPVGYSYPYNGAGYWGQAMTYYMPQPPLPNSVSSSIMSGSQLPLGSGGPGNSSGSANLGNINNSPNSIMMHGGSKRSSPPQQQQQSISSGSSQSTTPANTTYQYAAGVPVALTADSNGQPMYIPQSAMFPNILPYGPPTTQTTPASVLSHLPSQPNTVISPMISHPSAGQSVPPPLNIPMDPPPPSQQPQQQQPQQQQQQQQQTQSSTSSYVMSGNNSNSSNNNTGNRSGTPLSAPTTPLSNPLPLPQHSARSNPPLFATPPIMPNGFNSHISNNPYQNYSESQHHMANSLSSYDKKNSYAMIKKLGAGGGGGDINNSNGGFGGYNSNNRQNNYMNNPNQRKVYEYQNSSMYNYSTNNSTNPRPIYTGQPKRIGIEKPPSGNINSGSAMGNSYNSNNINHYISGMNSLAQNVSDNKPRPGIRQKPGNLDFKRNSSQRNSPSTNSAESNNNSPNSIASNHNHSMSGFSTGNNPAGRDYQHQSQSIYMARGPPYIPPLHASNGISPNDTAAAAACHQQLLGAYNHPASAVYFKYGQTYFAHPSMTLPNNRRSPPNDMRPSLGPLYPPTFNMMLPAPRQMQPRHPNPNYKGSKPSR